MFTANGELVVRGVDVIPGFVLYDNGLPVLIFRIHSRLFLFHRPEQFLKDVGHESESVYMVGYLMAQHGGKLFGCGRAVEKSNDRLAVFHGVMTISLAFLEVNLDVGILSLTRSVGESVSL